MEKYNFIICMIFQLCIFQLWKKNKSKLTRKILRVKNINEYNINQINIGTIVSKNYIFVLGNLRQRCIFWKSGSYGHRLVHRTFFESDPLHNPHYKTRLLTIPGNICQYNFSILLSMFVHEVVYYRGFLEPHDNISPQIRLCVMANYLNFHFSYKQ